LTRRHARNKQARDAALEILSQFWKAVAPLQSRQNVRLRQKRHPSLKRALASANDQAPLSPHPLEIYEIARVRVAPLRKQSGQLRRHVLEIFKSHRNDHYIRCDRLAMSSSARTETPSFHSSPARFADSAATCRSRGSLAFPEIGGTLFLPNSSFLLLTY
jgi:hypothetical protein